MNPDLSELPTVKATRQGVRSIVEVVADVLRRGEEPDLTDVLDDLPTLEFAAAARDEALYIAQAAKHVAATVDQIIVARLETAGAKVWVHAGQSYRRGPRPSTWKIADPAMFVQWVGDDLLKVARLEPKQGSLRNLAKHRGDVDPQTVIDTLLIETKKPDGLTVTPLEYAPQYVQAMQEGQTK